MRYGVVFLAAMLAAVLATAGCSDDPYSPPEDMSRESDYLVTLENVREDGYVYLTVSEEGLIGRVTGLDLWYSHYSGDGMTGARAVNEYFWGSKELAFSSGYLFVQEGSTIYLPATIKARVYWIEADPEEGGE